MEVKGHHNLQNVRSSQMDGTDNGELQQGTIEEILAAHQDSKNGGLFLEHYRKLIREYHSLWKQSKMVPYRKLFKYADSFDVFLMVMGLGGAVLNGLTLPAMLVIQSHVINNFGSLQNDPVELTKKVSQGSLYFVYTALISWLASYLEVSCWMHTGERQSARIREKYLRAILRQNVGFFDCETSTAQVLNCISEDIHLLQEAISEKAGNFIKNCSHFIGGYIVAFIQLWKMAILMIPFTPFLLLPGILYSIAISSYALKMQAAYGKAGTVAEQAISSIRTVYSFVAEKRTVKTYSESLEGIVNVGKRQGLARGLAIGSNGIVFALWALLGWYGYVLISHGEANGGQVLTTGFAVLTGGLALGNATPHVKSFLEGCIAAYRIFNMIDRVPPIDVSDLSGKKLERVHGKLELIKVEFAYPSRIETPVLKRFSLEVPPGQKVAIVGSSGSGKSTIISLLERYYDPLSGEILLDGINIKEFQLKWLREQMGLVSQEPSLFASSIKENILLGKENATIDEVMEAASRAGAHGFIAKLPNGYDTLVGEQGVQMSGGQKQRIAIARAMLKNPPILLLDEATSALDSESEEIVQRALDKASVGRTTVVVAHRLSTVYNADLIVVVKNGMEVEAGRHDELLAKGRDGAYASLFHLQQAQHEQADAAEHTKRTSDKLSYAVDNVGPRSTSEERNDDYSNFIVFQKMARHQGASFCNLLSLNRPEWKQCFLGLAGAAGFGVVQPMYAFVIGDMVSSYYSHDSYKIREHIKAYSSIFVFLAIAAFIVNLMQHYNFAVMGEHLTKRVREMMLSKIVTFEVAWFDKEENSIGALCSRLAADANMVRSLIGDRMSLLVQTASAVAVSIIISMTKAWRLALVMTAIQPLIIYCYFYRRRALAEYAQLGAKLQQEACQIANEAVSLHRTVTAFSAQERILSQFESKLERTKLQTSRRCHYSGICIGAADFVLFASWGLDFWYGGQLVKKGLASFRDVFQTFFVLVSTGRVLAEAGSLTPDIAKGSTAVKSIFKILDRVSKIDSDDQKAENCERIRGNVELRAVYFAYPSRPEVKILRDFNLSVQAGSTVALVGPSGSGKSTILGLIERFYDPLKGKVMIDGRNIRDIRLQSLRQHIALVNQEPTLFAASIRENIAYGKQECSEEEVMEAARAANAHNFISALPSGYATFAGERGVQLSGGQKQRIAIARAIARDPAILLLDEATSALDAGSERLVQGALDVVMEGRTAIVIAHRLSTIRGADWIAVVDDGRVVEQGSHEQLLAKGDGGLYFKLSRNMHSSYH